MGIFCYNDICEYMCVGDFMATVRLIAHTPQPEKVVAAAAKLCYSHVGVEDISENLTDEKAKSFVRMLSEIGHESPIEHVSFTFGIEGVSRALLAQFTRHRIASYSVQSQRYVTLEDFQYVTPPEIADIPEAEELFLKAMETDRKYYEELAKILKKHHKEKMISEGADEKSADKAAEKKAIEDARFVLPNACDTKMVVTMNARSLLNFFKHRCCNRAQWEIRDVAEQMYKIVYSLAPSLFCNAGPACTYGKCPEGKMSCGKITEMREKYDNIRKEV